MGVLWCMRSDPFTSVFSRPNKVSRDQNSVDSRLSTVSWELNLKNKRCEINSNSSFYVMYIDSALWMTFKNHALDPGQWVFFVCVGFWLKNTVDLRFDRYVKLGDFNAISLDFLIRRVCVFFVFIWDKVSKRCLWWRICFWLGRAQSCLSVILLLFIKHQGCRFIYILNWRIKVLKWQPRRLKPIALFVSGFRCFSFTLTSFWISNTKLNFF